MLALPWEPTPTNPIFTRLLGAGCPCLPKADAGITDGETTAAMAAFFKKIRRGNIFVSIQEVTIHRSISSSRAICTLQTESLTLRYDRATLAAGVVVAAVTAGAAPDIFQDRTREA
jgi:hypothetical protein